MKKILISSILSTALLFGFAFFNNNTANAQTSVTTTPPSPCVDIGNDLTIGSQGIDVVKFQTFLENTKGNDQKPYLVMPAYVSKGYFGPSTASSTAAFQKDWGIYPANGYVGPSTRVTIKNRTCSQLLNGYGINVVASSTSAKVDEYSDDTTADDVGVFKIKFGVTVDNWEADALVELSSFRYISDALLPNQPGVSYVISGAGENYGRSTASLSHISGGNREGNFVKIKVGETAVFELKVNYDPLVSGNYALTMTNLQISSGGISSPYRVIASKVLTPSNNYQTNSISIEDSGSTVGPTITSVSPNPVSSGQVIITGTGFTPTKNELVFELWSNGGITDPNNNLTSIDGKTLVFELPPVPSSDRSYNVRIKNINGISNVVSLKVINAAIVNPTAKLTANNKREITLEVGKKITYEWSSTGGTKFSSSYNSKHQVTGASCGGGTWIANTESGTRSFTLNTSHADCVYDVIYQVENSTGVKAEAKLVLKVINPIVIEKPTASLQVNGMSGSGTLYAGNSINYSWSSTNGVAFSSSYNSKHQVTGASCGGGTWIANTESGTRSFPLTSGHANCVYNISYKVYSSSGASTESKFILTVLPSTVSVVGKPSEFSNPLERSVQQASILKSITNLVSLNPDYVNLGSVKEALNGLFDSLQNIGR